MKRFARNLFRLARGAGRRGLIAEARFLLKEAVVIDPEHRGEYRLYRLAAGILGWERVARWAERFANKRQNFDHRAKVPEATAS